MLHRSGSHVRPPAAGLLVLGLVALLPERTQGQAGRVTIIHEEETPPFEVVLEPGPAFRSGGVDDAGWVAGVFDGVELLADGHIALWQQLWPDQFVVASPDLPGGRVVGRRGDGPGEYRFIRWVRVFDEEFFVFDLETLRLTVLDGSGFDVISTGTLPPGKLESDVVLLTDSTFVLNATMYTPERVGYVLHAVDREGSVLSSFDEVAFGVPDAPSHLRWLVAARHGRGVWAVPWDEYRLDLWDPFAGTRLRSLIREVDWFPPHVEHSWNPERLGSANVRSLAQDSKGHLWVLTSVPAPDRWAGCFEKATPDAHPMQGEYMVREGCFPYDARLEVLDPEQGRVLAATVLPQGSWQAVDSGILYTITEDTLGFPEIQLWTPRLQPKTSLPAR